MFRAPPDPSRLERALALARKSMGYVEPNPPVGCVVVNDVGAVVGESWHKAWGGAHAEVEALNMAGDRGRHGTLYVSLEPCARAGKTPACTDRIIAAGIRRVVYAARDPHPQQQGQADAILRAAGIEVIGPAAQPEGEVLLGRFQRALLQPRPWTIAKWAMSLDGRIALARGQGGALSGPKSRLLAHIHRGRMDAIAVGAHTARIDNPRLTCRLESGPPDGRAQPTRVVFATDLAVDVSGHLVSTAGQVPVIVVGADDAPASRRDALTQAGCEVWGVPRVGGGVDLPAALKALRAHGIERLLVEGGARIHAALFAAHAVDQVMAYVAPAVVGGSDPVLPLAGDLPTPVSLEDATWRKVGDDLFLNAFVPPDGTVDPVPDAVG